MKLFFSFFVFFSIAICCFEADNKSNNVEGNYISPTNNYINKLKYGVFLPQLTLLIKKDSTYTFTTCAQKENGKWKLEDNELKLFCSEKKFLIDSINKLERYKSGRVCDSVQSFTIKDNKITKTIYLNNQKVNMVLVKK